MELKKNEQYVTEIVDIGSQGEGIGKIDDFTVFVPNALPNDKAEVKIVKLKKNYAFGKIVKIIQPSHMRTKPECDVFQRCGGCTLQHLQYKYQLDFKTKKVKDSLERIGGFKNIKINDTIGMENPFRYRNKAQFPVGKNSDGNAVIGFYSPRSHNIIDCGGNCLIQNNINSEIIEIVKKFIDDYNISVYDENSRKGIVRHILTRIGYKTGEIMVCVVINSDDLPHSDKLVEKLSCVENMTSIVLNINKENTNVVLGNKIKIVWGRGFIYDFIGNLKFEISPLSFFQVNPVQTEILYKEALEAAGLCGTETVIDAYCGIGTISLFLAQKAKKVYGIEIVSEAISDAERNAKLNGIENVEFIVGKSEEIVPKLYREQLIKADVIVIDPPRKGCESSLLEMITEMKPEKIVYVSCDPATLARDLKIFCGGEKHLYKIEKVQPVDMFCMTCHVECVVLMTKV